MLIEWDQRNICNDLIRLFIDKSVFKTNKIFRISVFLPKAKRVRYCLKHVFIYFYYYFYCYGVSRLVCAKEF